MSAVPAPPHRRRTAAAGTVSVDEVMAPIYVASCRRFTSPDKSPPSGPSRFLSRPAICGLARDAMSLSADDRRRVCWRDGR